MGRRQDAVLVIPVSERAVGAADRAEQEGKAF
jgi:hypothetical protein